MRVANTFHFAHADGTPHRWPDAQQAWDHGRLAQWPASKEDHAMAHFGTADLPFHVALADAFTQPGLDRDIKWQARYARQNGIHVTPTFMVDGLVAPDIGSGDSVDQWLDKLGLA